MIKKFNIVILISTLFIITFSACNKESTLPIQNENQNSTNELKSLVSQVKFWHDSIVSNKTKGVNVENNIKSFSQGPEDITPPSIDWDKAFVNFDSNNIKSVTITLSMNYINGEKLQLVATKNKNSINGYLIKILPDSIYFSKQVDIYDYKKFNGSITIYNLKGVRLKKEIFKQGIVSKTAFNSKTSQSNQTTFDTEPPCDGCDLLTVVMHNSKRNSYRFGSYDYGLIYISSYYNIQVDGFDGGGGGGVYVGGRDVSDGIVDDININITDPCISSVMNDILSKDKQNEVMSYINREFGLNENCNMNISDVLNLTNLKGLSVAGNSTANRNNGILTVNISINYGKNSSKEFIAATILHEMIHGYIASQNIAQNGMEKEEVIANSQYVGWMSASLISLFPNLSSIDANALALGGLQETSYFKSLSKDTQDASNATNARHELGNEGQTCK
jgi:hypothetical protein